MFSIDKSWKEYRVNLKDLHAWMKANAGELYCGMSANTSLQIHFTEEPIEEVKSNIDIRWEALTTEGEAAKFTHDDNLQKAVDAASIAVLTLEWDSMITAERKIAMNRPLDDNDKEALLVKYPQA
jgi:hypothetical protein